MDRNREPPVPSGFPSWWSSLLWPIVFLILIVYFLGIYSGKEARTISYSEFKHRVGLGEVAEITFRGREITGIIKKVETSPQELKKTTPPRVSQRSDKSLQEEEERISGQFKTIMPALDDPELLKLLEQHNVTIKAESADRSWFGTLLLTLLPWVLIIGLFAYGSRKLGDRLGGAAGGPFAFSKSRARLYTRSDIKITFQDVAGLSNAKKELQEIVDFLSKPSKYRVLGCELPKGILLVGPPGTGKTLIARATAGEAGVPFFSISGSEFVEMFVGVGAARVRDMFSRAKKEAPSIIFIDEIDSIGRVRGSGLGGGHDEREQTLNQILSEMDGFAPHESVVVMAATNRPDVLDPALVRPGRFDRHITLELPQRKARQQILEIHTRKMPLAEDVNLETLAARTVGFSGADLKNLVNEAALLAARKNKSRVEAEDFEQARDKIIMGVKRDEMVSERERKFIAYHEAGHALLAKLLPEADPLEKVTIIPRGRSLGATEQTPKEDRYNLSRTYLLNRIAILLAGRVAEKIVFQDITSGAADDLKEATRLARRMVSQWGMSDRLGPITFSRGETHPFLGRELAEQRDFSEITARLIDEEIQRIVREMEKRAEQILRSNRDRLDILAQGLLEHESLSNEEVDHLLGFKKDDSDS
ncbi:MAG: ATP-dependent zinc metalloprotease FtsH [bacterium]|nr:ATP-dependent zinc metalloprotease FtsH [bacterium]